METDIQLKLRSIVDQAVADAGFGGQQSEISLASGFGDLSTNIAMRLASSLKQAPRSVAGKLQEKIAEAVAASGLKDAVREVKVEGPGFINFYLSHEYFHAVVRQIVRQAEDFGRINKGSGKEVMVEFVSANPTGPLSVAHARQAAVGDSLAMILDYAGYKVHKEYYLNDEGNQINILGRSVQLRLQELNGQTVEFPENHYQGDYIVDMARQIKEKAIDVKDFSEYAADQILAVIRKELEDFGVTFDCWYSQKALGKSGKIEEAFKFLKAKGFLYEQDGATWFKSTEFGDDKDRVVIKSDGAYTYLAPDIAYHRDKYERGFRMLINLWGPDHHGYIPRMKAAVAALGYDPESLNVVIVQLASIFRDNKPVEMSTRKGQYITLREVLDEVGVDASRFYFLMRKTSAHLAFDLQLAKKQTADNPVYYVQYAHARISSILRQSNQTVATLEGADVSVLKEKEELELIKKLWQFSFIVDVCAATLDPYMLTVYLQELAESFHRFYDRHRVLGDDPALRSGRLALILAAKTVLANGLRLAGVRAPETM